MKNQFYGGQFADKTFQEQLDLAWGRIVIAVGTGTGRDELAKIMMEYEAWSVKNKKVKETKQ